jgi:hypothetical protein
VKKIPKKIFKILFTTGFKNTERHIINEGTDIIMAAINILKGLSNKLLPVIISSTFPGI